MIVYKVRANLPRIGKLYGKRIPEIQKALSEADSAAIVRSLGQDGRFLLNLASGAIWLNEDDVLVDASYNAKACAEADGYLVVLDTTETPDLIREGLAREIVRSVQDARKQSGLLVSDRILLGVHGSRGIEDAIAEYRDYLMSETLATEWAIGQASPFVINKQLADESWTIEFSKA